VSAQLTIHVQPRARRTEVAGLHGDAIRVRLAAPPVDGAANDELVRYLASRLGVARRAVRIVGGATARRKVVEIDGVALDGARRALLMPAPGAAARRP
jgi:uncharacterized protein (TIGR00251 family)